MNFKILQSEMRKDEDGAYVGKTIFQVDSHKANYEITFFSKNSRDWDYSLHYAKESGVEEELLAVDKRIEQDDEWFDGLLDAAWNTYSVEE